MAETRDRSVLEALQPRPAGSCHRKGHRMECSEEPPPSVSCQTWVSASGTDFRLLSSRCVDEYVHF